MNTALTIALVFASIVVVALLVAIPILLVRRRLPSGRKELEAAAQARAKTQAEFERVGLQLVSASMLKWVCCGHHAGVRFECRVEPADASGYGRIEVCVPLPSPGQFGVRRETGGTELLRQMGLVKEFQTGDPAFDRKFFFSGISADYVKSVFGDSRTMQLMRELFDSGFDRLEKDGKTLAASKPQKGPPAAGECERVVEQLLAFDFPPLAPSQAGGVLGGKRMLYALRTITPALAIAAIACFSESRPLLDGWMAFAVGVSPIVVALCGAMLFAAWHALKGRAMAAHGIFELVFMLPVLAVSMVGLLAYANERFDGDEPETHFVRLMKRYQTPDPNRVYDSKSAREKAMRRMPTYWLAFESWRGKYSETFDVPFEKYGPAREGEMWGLRTGRGWLGHAWLESMRQGAGR